MTRHPTRLLIQRDYYLLLTLNRWSKKRLICGGFRAISSLGDGPIWYATVLLLPLVYGLKGLQASATLTLATLSGVIVYRIIKRHFRRPRPYRQHESISAKSIALDEWSFPSGHTLHATAFTIILFHYFPVLGWLFLPFAILTGLSRVILGLHYPSDVLAGILVGATLAQISLSIFGTLTF